MLWGQKPCLRRVARKFTRRLQVVVKNGFADVTELKHLVGFITVALGKTGVVEASTLALSGTGDSSVHLSRLLACFHGARNVGQHLFRQLEVWVGEVIEGFDLRRLASTDALDMKVCKGNKRARVIHPGFKLAVSKEANAVSARSGRSVLRDMQRHRRFKFFGSLPSASAFFTLGTARYFAACKDLMQRCSSNVICIAADGKWFDEKEHRLAALYNRSARLSFWCPPQVTRASFQTVCESSKTVFARTRSLKFR